MTKRYEPNLSDMTGRPRICLRAEFNERKVTSDVITSLNCTAARDLQRETCHKAITSSTSQQLK